MNNHRHISKEKLPRHVAIIMDGNGRWARQRGKERIFGHYQGVESVRRIVEAARELEIPYLTLYTFSTENWQRPQEEVNGLMELLVESLEGEKEKMIENQIRLFVVGNKSGLPQHVQNKLEEIFQATGQNHRLTLSLALNYGGRQEILDAVAKWCKEGKGDTVPEDAFAAGLSSGILPDVDLMIRTGGERRISNFLLWKLAYAELYFTETLWPDFGKEDFYEAIHDYQQRERRFGKTSEQIKNDEH